MRARELAHGQGTGRSGPLYVTRQPKANFNFGLPLVILLPLLLSAAYL